MKIFYDYQIFTEQKYGGVSRYFYEIIKRIKEENHITVKLQVFLSQNYYINQGFKLFSYDKIKDRSWHGNLAKINRAMTLPHLLKNSYDIIHPTYYHPYILKVKGNAKLVVTVHDMIHEIFKLDDETIQNKNIMIHAADKIIAVSECTKKDLLEWYPDIPEEKVVVVYHGANITQQGANIKNRERFQKKYILYVGSRGGYKNFKNFMSAVKIVFDQCEDLFLICAGGGEFPESAYELMRTLQIEGRVSRYDLSDEELAFAYKNAMCFVFPSKYEGFGIPALEAFENDCPVILSNTSSLPEVGGDAALYFDPLNPQDMANKILEAIHNEDKRDELVMLGKKRLAEFSWEKAAEQTLEIYEKLKRVAEK